MCILISFIAFFQICALIKAKNVTEHILTAERVPYIVDGDLWVGYDNTQSITEKVTFYCFKGFYNKLCSFS